jgi:uncharacterized protein
LLKDLRKDPDVNILPPTAELFEEGIALYISRPDKQWSLTDSISFRAMKHERITDAVTADRDFKQPRFRTLFG